MFCHMQKLVTQPLLTTGMSTTIGPRQGSHFVVPVGLGAGTPGPLGPSLVEVTGGSGPDAQATLNFAVSVAAAASLEGMLTDTWHALAAKRPLLGTALSRPAQAVVVRLAVQPFPRSPRACAQVFSRHAASMSLCLLRADGGGYLEVGLDPGANRTGDVWHVQIRGLKGVGGLVYGWRAGGDKTWAGAWGQRGAVRSSECDRHARSWGSTAPRPAWGTRLAPWARSAPSNTSCNNPTPLAQTAAASTPPT